MNSDFEDAFIKAGHVLAKAEGHISYELKKCMESRNQYLVLIKWQTLEDHTNKFIQSDFLKELGYLIGKYFVAAPSVNHYELIKRF